jgi:hypothetical protein
VFWKNLRKTRLELVRAIGVTSLESTKSVYPALAKLQFLGEIEHAWNLRWEEDKRLIDATPSPMAAGTCKLLLFVVALLFMWEGVLPS